MKHICDMKCCKYSVVNIACCGTLQDGYNRVRVVLEARAKHVLQLCRTVSTWLLQWSQVSQSYQGLYDPRWRSNGHWWVQLVY